MDFLMARTIVRRPVPHELADVLPMDQVLADTLFGIEHGRLENGLCYYIGLSSNPKGQAALALALKVGSVLEEEEEHGVANLIGYLAYNGTSKYSNHDIMESVVHDIGSQGPRTSTDVTIFTFLVPADKPDLSQGISILSEFSSEVRISKNDLENVKGTVLENYRRIKNAEGRRIDSHMKLLLEGSKYAERLPYGLEKVIRTVSFEMVKQFYEKWYHLHNMAVVAVGDFTDTESVVSLIRNHFGHKGCNQFDCSPIREFPVPFHKEPRFSRTIGYPGRKALVAISWKVLKDEVRTVKDYRDKLAEKMFITVLNNRFLKISSRKNAQFSKCSIVVNKPTGPVISYSMTSSCNPTGVIKAFESMLMEVARVRLYGFSEQEIDAARATRTSSNKFQRMKEQMNSTKLRRECLAHFFNKKPYLGIEADELLENTILPHISALEVSKFAEKFRTQCSCMVMVVESRASATVEDLKGSVFKINFYEEEGNISTWQDELRNHVSKEIIKRKPKPGKIIRDSKFASIGVSELLLSNGMTVSYKCTDFLDCQIVFTGFAFGGLSEVQESDFISCFMGGTIAEDIGKFGFEPDQLRDMLAGQMVEFKTKIGSYMRKFSCVCSPSSLETALQLVYQLFTTNVVPGDVHAAMERVKGNIVEKLQDPFAAFRDQVRGLKYGNFYSSRQVRICDIPKLDPIKACQYFTNCFKDPSTFTVVIVGNFDPSMALPSILKYLGGIPKPSEPILRFHIDDIKGLPLSFPASSTSKVIHGRIAKAQHNVYLAFPVELKNRHMEMEEIHLFGFLDKFLETKILEAVQTKHGKIFTYGHVYLDGMIPHRRVDFRGDISINFACELNKSWELVDTILNEIQYLQEKGPSDEDIQNILEMEQTLHEGRLQENSYWMYRILCGYQAPSYFDVSACSYNFEVRDKTRIKVRESLTPSMLQCALQTMLPFPCRERYGLYILMPELS